MEGLALTGASVDRERGLALDHRARDGRIVGFVRAAEARRAGDSDGAHRHAHRNSGAGNRSAGRRRTRQRGAVLDRPGASRAADRAPSISPDTRRSSTAIRWRKSKRPRTWWSGAATKRPASRRAACRTKPSSEISWKRCAAYGRGDLDEPEIPLHAGRPAGGHRLGRDDGRRGARAAHGRLRRI